MKRCDRVLLLAVFALALPSLKARAQGDESGDVKKEVQALRAEVAELKSALGEVDKQIKALLTEVKKVQAPAAPPKPPPDTTVYDINVGDSPYRGPKDAPVTIAVFSEFQCPFCSREATTVEQVAKDYPNDVKVVFKQLPKNFMPGPDGRVFHNKARAAAAAAAFAQKQKGNDAFWKMHDLIFADQKKMELADLRAHAETMGLDMAAYDAFMADYDPTKPNPNIDGLFKADDQEATKCKVQGSPTVFINGLRLYDRQVAGYKARIDEILAQKKKAS